MLDQPLSERLRAAREAQAAPAEEPAPAAPPEQPRRVPLGELLVEKGALSRAELEVALSQQRRDGRPLGQILLEMGVVNQSDLARTLTEQQGFDPTGSLRRRLTSVEDPEPQPEPGASEPPTEHDDAGRYEVRESPSGEPLHVADSFLDAADAAFELIDERDPEQLEIVRIRGSDAEGLWSYRRGDGPPPAAA